ncbi:two-component system response regulator YesN [Paenibacillus rhizosphaerae]|uniref:Two-component system response regulator YesN n=1 Tax=Paenibacillus rhizosphaerae TaxID=297318 RepID=A0A839THL4_9BACL|nr:response regulator [Paenibacillus rhizosphaerae]MBB3126134.1 two-component system response regulator YesN [Paenibacillus rhizosphaerae]
MTVNSEQSRKIKMLIVDDEAVIREGLRHTIDWVDFDVEVVGEAEDGREALQRIAECGGVDLVLSDIRMDGMDGLQLAERLKVQFPEVWMILVSGYEDFDYARQAMRLGVTDYLLKPVDIDELTAVVKGVVSRIDRQEDIGMQEARLWFAGLVRHGFASGKVPVSLQGKEYLIVASQIADYHDRFGGTSPDELEALQNRWSKAIHRPFDDDHCLESVSVMKNENLMISLIVVKTPQERQIWDHLLSGMIARLEEVGTVYFGVSTPFNTLERAASACTEAVSLLPYYVLEGHPLLLPEYRESLEMQRGIPNYDTATAVRELVSRLFKQDPSELGTFIADMFTVFRETGLLLEDILHIYEELWALLRQQLRRSGMPDMDAGTKAAADLNIYNSYDSLQKLVLDEMLELQRQVNVSGLDKSYWIIEKAKKYMDDQFRMDLKASEVASWLKITPSHFSYIFKQSTGKGFTEYMNEKRINHAKKLLATTHDKVFEIADQAGYNEYKYFVSVFKTYTGMTPKEYRGLMAGKKAEGE